MLKRLLKTSAIKNVLGGNGGGGMGGGGGGGSAAAALGLMGGSNGLSSLHDSGLLRPQMFDFGPDMSMIHHHSSSVMPYKKEHLA